MAQSLDASLDRPPLADGSRRELPTAVPPARRFLLGWILSWAVVGCVVAGGFAFATDVDFGPALRLSILFAEVVGFTAFVSARMIFPLFARLPYGLRLVLEVLTLLSATIFGSVGVIWFQPLFSLAQPRAVAMIVLINAALAVIVGTALSTYDRMRAQIEASYLELRQKEALERELAIAREVQRELLPRAVPALGGIELAGVCLSARAVGGDYYDFVQLGDEQLGLVVADVSGKGVAAALHMACLQASVRSLFRIRPDIGLLNAELNEHLYRSSSGSRYATLFAGSLDLATRTLSYSNAGHHPPLLLRGGRVERLTEGGLPLGLFEGCSYRSERHQLEAGDLLALFTDGITETPDANEDEFGEARLIESLRRCDADAPLGGMIEKILDEVTRWSDGAEAHDDVTLVLARVR
jgi:serine phosphatase RsbU (regulator of sigma subunit)